MRNLELLINKNCNLNCSYCGIVDNSLKEKSSEIKRNKFADLLNENFDNCYILGGEPSINDDFLFILEELTKRNINIFVYSNSKIKQDLSIFKNYNVKFILSFHKENTEFSDFLKMCKKLYKLGLLHSIKVMFNKNTDSIISFNLIKYCFRDIKVFLEPTFAIVNDKMDISNIELVYNEKYNVYSEILNIKSKFFNFNIGDIFLNNNLGNQICKIMDYSITYDFQESKIYRCLTDCLKKEQIDSDVCNNTYCLCDVDKIKEFL